MKLHLDSPRASATRKVLTAFLAVQMVVLNFTPARALEPTALPSTADTRAKVVGDGVMEVTPGGGQQSINWGSFNIGSDAAVHFKDAPGDVTLNHISGGKSEIFGLLDANGIIYLLNRSGVLFGSGSRVNVGGLVASTMDYDPDTKEFSNPGSGDITVDGGASINAGAFAYLIGNAVNLSGAVNAGDVQVVAYGGETEDIELTTANGGKILLKLAGNTATNGGSITITNGFSNTNSFFVLTNDAALTTNSVAISNITLYAVSEISQVGNDSAWTANAPVTMTAAGGNITLGNAANSFGGAVSATADKGAVTLNAAQNLEVGNVKAGQDVSASAGETLSLDGAMTSGGTVVLKAPSIVGTTNSAVVAGNNVYAGGSLASIVASNSETGVVTTNFVWNTFGTTNISLAGKLSATNDVRMYAGNTIILTNDAVEVVPGFIQLEGTVEAGKNLQLDTLGAGAIAQGTNGAPAVKVGGETILDTGNGTITLGSTANDFAGAVTATATNGGVTLADANGIELGAVTASSLTVTAGGDITQSGVAQVTGATTLEAAKDITLANESNDFTDAVSASGQNVTLTDANSLLLGDVTANQDLKATALNGNITQTTNGTVTATGTTTLAATAGDITLDNAANDFTGAVSADGANVTLTDANSLLLGDVTAKQNLNATALSGSITQTTDGKVTATGTTTLAATAGDITLDNAANDFTGAVSADGANVTLTDANSLLLGDVTASQDLNATALSGSITQTTDGTMTATGTTTLAATAGDILLANVGNDFGGEVKEATAADGSIALADKNSLELVSVTAGANATLVAQGNLTVKEDATIEAGKDLALLSDGNIATEAGSTLTGDNVVLVAASDVDLTTANIHGRNVGIEASAGYIKDSNDGEAKANVKADETMILVAGDEVEIHSDLLVTKSLGVQAKDDITFDNLNVENFAATSTGGNVTVNTIRDVNLAGGGKVEAVRADIPAKVVVGASNLDGIQAAKDVDLTAHGLTVSGSKVAAGGDVELDAANYSVGGTSAGGNLTAEIGNASVGSMTAGNQLNATVHGNLAASGTVSGSSLVHAEVDGSATIGTLSGGTIELEKVGGNAEIGNMNTTGPVDMNVTGSTTLGNSSVGGPLTIVSGGALTSDEMTVNGKLNTDAGGATTLKKTTVHGDAEIQSSGTLTFDQLTANNVKVTKSGSICMGKLNTGTADLKTSGSITDNGSLAKVRTLTMTAGGDIGSAGKPINTEVSSKIEQISGKNIYLVEQSSGHDIVLGTIDASGHLSLTAPRIGLPDGQYGFVDGNGDAVNLHAGSGLELDIAGFFGQPGDPMEAEVNGDWTLRSGSLHGMSNGDPSTGTPLNLIYMVFGNTLYTVTPVYDGDGPIPGLVIVNGRPVQGHPDLLRRIYSALAFTADTPELKSTQGVFGNPLFLHTDLALTDMGALGLVDYLTFMQLSLQRPDLSVLRDSLTGDGQYLLEQWGADQLFPKKDQKTLYNQPAILRIQPKPAPAKADPAKSKVTPVPAKSGPAEKKGK